MYVRIKYIDHTLKVEALNKCISLLVSCKENYVEGAGRNCTTEDAKDVTM